MRLSDYLREELILHGLEAENRDSALEAFAGLFEEAGLVPAESGAAAALKDREESHTTCLGKGIAVPHATVSGIPQPLLLVASAGAPFPFGPPEADPVDLFFVLLSPPGRQGEHIKLLARICRLAQHPEDLKEVRNATDIQGLLQALLLLDSRHV